VCMEMKMLSQPKALSKWYATGAPMACAGCGQPFPREGNHVRCLRTEHGFFCDEFCEVDHLIANVVRGRDVS
jgi:hypothetical protein